MPIVIRRARVRVGLLAVGDSKPAAKRHNSDGKILLAGWRGRRETATGRSWLASFRYIRRRFAIIWSTFSGFLAGERDFPSRRGAYARNFDRFNPVRIQIVGSTGGAAPHKPMCSDLRLHGNFQVSASTRLDHPPGRS